MRISASIPSINENARTINLSERFTHCAILLCCDARRISDSWKTIACGSRRCRRPSVGPWRPVFLLGRRSSGSGRHAVRAGTPRFWNASSTAARSGASRISSACPPPGSRRPTCRSGCSERNAASCRCWLAGTAALLPDGGRRSADRTRCNIVPSRGAP